MPQGLLGGGGVIIMKPDGEPARSPLRFFILVFAIAVPLGLAGHSLGVVGSARIPAADLGLAFVR